MTHPSLKAKIAILTRSTMMGEWLQELIKSRFPRIITHLFYPTDHTIIAATLLPLKPDLVIATTDLITDLMLPLLKKQLEPLQAHYLAFSPLSVEDESCLKHFDGAISIYSTPDEVIDALQDLLCTDQETKSDGSQELTAREQEVVIGVVKGWTNKEIADKLNISHHTVITHRRNIAKKLQIHSSSGLTIYAIVNKLVKLSDIKR